MQINSVLGFWIERIGICVSTELSINDSARLSIFILFFHLRILLPLFDFCLILFAFLLPYPFFPFPIFSALDFLFFDFCSISFPQRDLRFAIVLFQQSAKLLNHLHHFIFPYSSFLVWEVRLIPFSDIMRHEVYVLS